jgi:hypothetical protein
MYIYANPHWIRNWIRMMDWDGTICIIWWCFYCCLVIKLVSLHNNFFCWISWFKIHANVVYCMCLMNNQVAFKTWMRNYVNYHLNQFQIDLMMQILDPKCTSTSQKVIDRVCFMALSFGKNDEGVMAIMANWCKKRTCVSTIKVATYPPKGHWKQLNWISHYCMTPNLFKVLTMMQPRFKRTSFQACKL